jgi:6-phosphogluconate dehydrogenase
MKKNLGFIGLGRMGGGMAARLVEAGYTVVGTDVNEVSLQQARGAGVSVVLQLKELVEQLPAPKVVWIMVPSQLVDAVLETLVPLLQPGDTIIDGGNSFYKDSLRRHEQLRESSIYFLDCGTSGGTDGARDGASLMVGGNREVFETHEHIFSTLAAPNAYARVGNAGAGHFVKMIHNGIEYGMMGAIAEGMSVLHAHETQFGIDIPAVFKPYEHESVIASKLVSWLKKAYDEGQIEVVQGEVPTGETEAEMEHIVAELGDVKVLQAALQQRKDTRLQPSYLGKLLAAMRNQFGGHAVIPKE